MKIIVNGKEVYQAKETIIMDLLQDGYIDTLEYITVQVNNVLLTKNEYKNYLVKEGDIIEFLYYMGGGK